MSKGEQKFGTHFSKWYDFISDDILVGGDLKALGIESDYSIPNENNRRACVGHDKSQKLKIGEVQD